MSVLLGCWLFSGRLSLNWSRVCDDWLSGCGRGWSFVCFAARTAFVFVPGACRFRVLTDVRLVHLLLHLFRQVLRLLLRQELTAALLRLLVLLRVQ